MSELVFKTHPLTQDAIVLSVEKGWKNESILHVQPEDGSMKVWYISTIPFDKAIDTMGKHVVLFFSAFSVVTNIAIKEN